jgi:hypothetical protein
VNKTKSALLATAAYYAPPTDQAAPAPEAPKSTAQRPAYTPKSERPPSGAWKGQPQQARAPPDDSDAGVSAMSIARFCRRNDLSEPLYYKLQVNGLGPKTMRVGARTLISIEAERRWRQERERKPVNVEALDKARRERNARKDAAAAAIPMKEEPGTPIASEAGHLDSLPTCERNEERDEY